jgi:3-hydroxyacyl-CoA dehydrogenase
MGAGIAAQVANAGVPCLLLDIVPEGAEDRNQVAEGARQRLLKSNPAALMHKRTIDLIEAGNIEDDLDRLADCDWIIEAVIEKKDVKQSLYRKIDAVRRRGAVVSSNTSTLPLAHLIEGMPDAFAEDFFITHFFNPPRYMRLLEIVAGPGSDPRSLRRLKAFVEERLGKGVVFCKDTPGFIANRLGIYWLQCAVVSALDMGVTVEEADSVIGRPLGIPKTGVFGLLDMVGLDLMPHVLSSMQQSLPADDAFHDIYRKPELIEKMIAEGYSGRKGKGGFYRLKPDSKAKVKEAVDLTSGAYKKAKRPKLKSVAAAKKGGAQALLSHGDKGGRYAWQVMSKTLCYALDLVPDAADSIADVDEAMRLGYNWKYGPFELLDRIGPAWFRDRLESEGRRVPPLLAAVGEGRFYRINKGRLEYLVGKESYRALERPEGVLLLADIKRGKQPLARNKSASLWDIGDGIACLEFHSRMNSLNPLTLRMVDQSLRVVKRNFKGLVIYNEGSNFSVGANIFLASLAARFGAWFVIGHLLRKGQGSYSSLKHAPFPVVGAPSGMALGGGCEILLHCDAV